LVDGIPNIEKQDAMPSEWLSGPHFTSEQARQRYLEENDLGDLPGEFLGFLDFYDQRRDRTAGRLRALLIAPVENAPPLTPATG
jgi:hypothetical protein